MFRVLSPGIRGTCGCSMHWNGKQQQNTKAHYRARFHTSSWKLPSLATSASFVREVGRFGDRFGERDSPVNSSCRQSVDSKQGHRLIRRGRDTLSPNVGTAYGDSWWDAGA